MGIVLRLEWYRMTPQARWLVSERPWATFHLLGGSLDPRLQSALSGLEAEPIAVPPFERAYLERGHEVHFRAHHPEAAGLRV
jgi:hypothetical protein